MRFYDMLEIRSDPTHEQHAKINDWFAGYYPEKLDVLPIEIALVIWPPKHTAAAKQSSKEARRPPRPSSDG